MVVGYGRLLNLDADFAAWQPDAFDVWVRGHRAVRPGDSSLGRRLAAKRPLDLDQCIEGLIRGLAARATDWPMPYIDAELAGAAA